VVVCTITVVSDMITLSERSMAVVPVPFTFIVTGIENMSTEDEAGTLG
jgi:Na+/H+-dicarboxylate symporter